MAKLYEIMPEILKGRRFRPSRSSFVFKTLTERRDQNCILSWDILMNEDWELEEEMSIISTLELLGVDRGKFIVANASGKKLDKGAKRSLAYAIMDLIEEFKDERKNI